MTLLVIYLPIYDKQINTAVLRTHFWSYHVTFVSNKCLVSFMLYPLVFHVIGTWAKNHLSLIIFCITSLIHLPSVFLEDSL